MAEETLTPREQMREYYHRRAIAAGIAQPLRQGELFRQTEELSQQQTRQQRQQHNETNVVVVMRPPHTQREHLSP